MRNLAFTSRRLAAGAAVGLALAWGGARPAAATTSEGALITNLASATYRTTGGATITISYGATAVIQVATPAVMLKKAANTTLQASGGTITFCLSFSNTSALTSAMNLVVSDTMPDNVRFVNGAGDVEYDPAGGVIYPAWSTNGTSWTTGSYPLTGQAGPVYLKWTVDIVGPKQSGYMCYTVSVL